LLPRLGSTAFGLEGARVWTEVDAALVKTTEAAGVTRTEAEATGTRTEATGTQTEATGTQTQTEATEAEARR
jgi:hypothetical protein